MKKRTHSEHGPRHITAASRSVFFDLGFDEAEARIFEMRADLMAALREHIEKRGWTQSEAAKKLGTTQPRVSALMKGAWDFSADMLLVLAARVGLQPTLKLVAERRSALTDHPFAGLEGVFGAVKLPRFKGSLREKVRRRLGAKNGNRRRGTP